MPTAKKPKKLAREPVPTKIPEILDVGLAAAFLTVSRDTVYHLFQSGQLPGRKVGRKWVTTKSAVIRWLEDSSANDSLTRAVERGDRDALASISTEGFCCTQMATGHPQTPCFQGFLPNRALAIR